jgi:uncharacterized membrane protein
MLDALLEATALPNLHPAVVHFPIALAAVALLFDAVLFARRRWVSLDASGAFLWVLAAAGAGAAYLAGEQAAEDAGLLESAAEEALGKHADAALATLIALSLFALFRVWLAQRSAGVRRKSTATWCVPKTRADAVRNHPSDAQKRATRSPSPRVVAHLSR